MGEDKGFTVHELEQFDRNIEHASNDLRNKALHGRHGAGWLRQEVELRTKWDEHDTRMRLEDRVDHLDAVLARLQQAHDLVEVEIKDLTEVKAGLDKGLTGRHGLIANVNEECLSLCEARQGINNVHDEVEQNLIQVRQTQQNATIVEKIPSGTFFLTYFVCGCVIICYSSLNKTLAELFFLTCWNFFPDVFCICFFDDLLQ